MTAPTDTIDPEEKLASWRAEEAAARARLQTAPGVASPSQAIGRSALQKFQTPLANEIPPQPMQVLTKAKLQATVAEHVTPHANKPERAKTFFRNPFVKYAG